MIMPGRNELSLCPAAVQEMLEQSLRRETLPSFARVTGIKFVQDGGTTMTVLTLTTDEPEPAV